MALQLKKLIPETRLLFRVVSPSLYYLHDPNINDIPLLNNLFISFLNLNGIKNIT